MPSYPPVKVRLESEQKGMLKCGFCTWPSTHTITAHGETPVPIPVGTHPHCPIAVLNGDEITVVRCRCECARLKVKCFTCGLVEDVDVEAEELLPKERVKWLAAHATSEAMVNPDTWRCYDPDQCAARIQRRRDADPNYQMIQRFLSESPTKAKVERAARTSSRPSSGVCLHCQEPTKGGLFLPGHDASFLSAAIKSISAGTTTLPDTLDAWAGMGISEALRAKLEKRAA